MQKMFDRKYGGKCQQMMKLVQNMATNLSDNVGWNVAWSTRWTRTASIQKKISGRSVKEGIVEQYYIVSVVANKQDFEQKPI